MARGFARSSGELMMSDSDAAPHNLLQRLLEVERDYASHHRVMYEPETLKAIASYPFEVLIPPGSKAKGVVLFVSKLVVRREAVFWNKCSVWVGFSSKPATLKPWPSGIGII
jgi:hypothetical protein